MANGPFSRKRLIDKLDVMAGIVAGVLTTGTIFYVSSVSGSNSNTGTDPSKPFATLDYAIGQCTANLNDIILVMPGHTETLASAAAVALDVAGVQVIGIGKGHLRPTFTFATDTAASFDISANDCSIRNLYFVNAIDAQTTMLNITGAGVTVEENEFDFADASTQASCVILTTAAADRLSVLNNRFYGTTDAGCAQALKIVGGNDIKISGNYCHGAFTTSLGFINNVTTAGLRWIVEKNTVVNATASSTVCMTFVSTTTGVCRENILSVLSGTAPIVGAALNAVGANYYKAAAGAAAGTLI